MARPPHHRALTLIETVITLVLIAVLLSILLPALSTARVASYRAHCQSNLKRIGNAWADYLIEHNKQFPFVAAQPGWYYGGVRFSSVDGSPFPDMDRPLTGYMGLERSQSGEHLICRCPADHGISDPQVSVGTGKRTAFRSFGTSYRANSALLDARIARIADEPRGMHRSEITTAPSRLVLSGDAVWFEVAEATGRDADWHHEPNAGNVLFLDGSVRFMTIKPRTDRNQAIVFDPVMEGTAPMAATAPTAAPTTTPATTPATTPD